MRLRVLGVSGFRVHGSLVQELSYHNKETVLFTVLDPHIVAT